MGISTQDKGFGGLKWIFFYVFWEMGIIKVWEPLIFRRPEDIAWLQLDLANTNTTPLNKNELAHSPSPASTNKGRGDRWWLHNTSLGPSNQAHAWSPCINMRKGEGQTASIQFHNIHPIYPFLTDNLYPASNKFWTTLFVVLWVFDMGSFVWCLGIVGVCMGCEHDSMGSCRGRGVGWCYAISSVIGWFDRRVVIGLSRWF